MPDEIFSDLEEFTCAMYGNLRFRKEDELRLFKIKEKCEGKPTDALRNIDMGTFPPCKRCLVQHIKRVNYQVSIWKNAHIPDPEIPAVSEEYGWTVVNGYLEPLWIEGALLLPRMVDILEETLEGEGDEDDKEESDVDLTEMDD